MGYTTTFRGQLKFVKPLSSEALSYLSTFLCQDRRDIGLNGDDLYKQGYGKYWYHIDYELTEDNDGIRWNGCEKSYDMEHIANFLIDKMREKYPSFALYGYLTAKGEDSKDRWKLIIGPDGKAYKKERE